MDWYFTQYFYQPLLSHSGTVGFALLTGTRIMQDLFAVTADAGKILMDMQQERDLVLVHLPS
jgi:hypothetical protein